MTTIAAKRNEDGTVSFAWDAQVTAGSLAVKHFIKVRKINDQFAVGISGHLRFANIIHRAAVEKIHKAIIVHDEFDPEEWVIESLIPAWGKALQKASDNGTADDPWGYVILVLCGRIFEIAPDFSVCDMGPWAATGSGGPYARAAMHLGKTAKEAVEIASELDLFTGGEVKEMTL